MEQNGSCIEMKTLPGGCVEREELTPDGKRSRRRFRFSSE